MCNNEYKCKVTINSQGDGWQDEQRTDGEFTNDGTRVQLKYKLDGDNCILTFDGKTVTQQRAGENNLSLTFREGESCECTLTSGGMNGSFEIFTDEIKYTVNENNFKLFLKYSSGGDREKINLKLTAEKIGG
ncbi:MAG: DUF1934 domain-containing protein [Clostridia bacterium]|nr:DUF1934 domain-containing protein [Clostridia bacterium]